MWFYVLLSLNVRISVLWDVMPYRFGKALRLHRHGRRVVASASFSENISAFYQITRSGMLEDIYLQTSVFHL
jgi:hypothetical protein